MPELPEIEVLRRSLEKRLVGRRIERVDVRNRALREPISPFFARRVRGREILALRRRAKYLWIDLEGDLTLVVHLGMSGRLTLVDRAEPPEPHEHLSLDLHPRGRLRLRDPRRFGLVMALPTSNLDSDHHFAGLGVEPLDREFSGASLSTSARGRRGPVKSFLMDGRIVAGVGNIYATEALFGAGVHPHRSVARISARRWDTLAQSVRDVLAQAIRQGGTTLNDFADGDGNAGYFQVELRVYGRAGEPCPRCGALVRRSVLGGRSSFHCPRCQR